MVIVGIEYLTDVLGKILLFKMVAAEFYKTLSQIVAIEHYLTFVNTQFVNLSMTTEIVDSHVFMQQFH